MVGVNEFQPSGSIQACLWSRIFADLAVSLQTFNLQATVAGETCWNSLTPTMVVGGARNE